MFGSGINSFFELKWHLFYLLDYITHQSEKLRFVKKKKWFGDQLARNFQILAQYCFPKKNFNLSISICQFVKLLTSIIMKCCLVISTLVSDNLSKNGHLQMLPKLRKLQYVTIYRIYSNWGILSNRSTPWFWKEIN